MGIAAEDAAADMGQIGENEVKYRLRDITVVGVLSTVK